MDLSTIIGTTVASVAGSAHEAAVLKLPIDFPNALRSLAYWTVCFRTSCNAAAPMMAIEIRS